MKTKDVVCNSLLMLIISIIIGIVGRMDTKNDYQVECAYCHQMIHTNKDDYVCASHTEYYHPE